MAFSNPLVVTIGGSGGTAKNLDRINQDNYGAEYYLREATMEYTVKIRHTIEAATKARPFAIDRHNVTLTQTIFGTAPAPDVVRDLSLVLRNRRSDVPADIGDLGAAFSYMLSEARYLDLVGLLN